MGIINIVNQKVLISSFVFSWVLLLLIWTFLVLSVYVEGGNIFSKLIVFYLDWIGLFQYAVALLFVFRYSLKKKLNWIVGGIPMALFSVFTFALPVSNDNLVDLSKVIPQKMSFKELPIEVSNIFRNIANNKYLDDELSLGVFSTNDTNIERSTITLSDGIYVYSKRGYSTTLSVGQNSYYMGNMRVNYFVLHKNELFFDKEVFLMKEKLQSTSFYVIDLTER
ncbi:hypothetical protein [Saprospira grandis]|nr:hypothetical protein [Saprospira grandis]